MELVWEVHGAMSSPGSEAWKRGMALPVSVKELVMVLVEGRGIRLGPVLQGPAGAGVGAGQGQISLGQCFRLPFDFLSP